MVNIALRNDVKRYGLSSEKSNLQLLLHYNLQKIEKKIVDGFTGLIRNRYRLVLHHHSWVQVQRQVLQVECIDYRLELRHQNQGRVQETQHLRLFQKRTHM